MENFWIPFGGTTLGVIVFFLLYQWRGNVYSARDKLPDFSAEHYLLTRTVNHLTAWMLIVGALIIGSTIWMMVIGYLYGQTFTVLGCVNG